MWTIVIWLDAVKKIIANNYKFTGQHGWYSAIQHSESDSHNFIPAPIQQFDPVSALKQTKKGYIFLFLIWWVW